MAKKLGMKKLVVVGLSLLVASTGASRPDGDAWCSQCMWHLNGRSAQNPKALAASHIGTTDILNQMCHLAVFKRTPAQKHAECISTFQPLNPTCASCCNDVMRHKDIYCFEDFVSGMFNYKMPGMSMKEGCGGKLKITPGCGMQQPTDAAGKLAVKLQKIENRIAHLKSTGMFKNMQTDAIGEEGTELRTQAEARDLVFDMRRRFRTIMAKIKVSKLQIKQLRTMKTDPNQAGVVAAAEEASKSPAVPSVTPSADNPTVIDQSLTGLDAEVSAVHQHMSKTYGAKFNRFEFTKEIKELKTDSGIKASLMALRAASHPMVSASVKAEVNKNTDLPELSKDTQTHVTAFLTGKRMYETIDKNMREISELIASKGHLQVAAKALMGSESMSQLSVQRQPLHEVVHSARDLNSKLYLLSMHLHKMARDISSPQIRGLLTQGNEVAEVSTQAKELGAVQSMVAETIKFLERTQKTAASCTSMLASGNVLLDDPQKILKGASGLYNLMPSLNAPFQTAYCDMQTDGGGWMLATAYRHMPGKTTIDGSHLPADPDMTTGTGGSHLEVAEIGLGASDILDVRFYCTSAGHERTLHFKTSNYNVKRLVSHGKGVTSLADWKKDAEVITGHTAVLPEGATYSGAGDMDPDMFNTPFWSNKAMWNMGGRAQSWMCDEVNDVITGGDDHVTHHQVWVRAEVDTDIGNITVADVDKRMEEFTERLDMLDGAVNTAGKRILTITEEVTAHDFSGLTQTELRDLVQWCNKNAADTVAAPRQLLRAAAKQLKFMNESDAVTGDLGTQLDGAGAADAAAKMAELKRNITSVQAVLNEKSLESTQLQEDMTAASGDKETEDSIDAEMKAVRKERGDLQEKLESYEKDLQQRTTRSQALGRMNDATKILLPKLRTDFRKQGESKKSQ